MCKLFELCMNTQCCIIVCKTLKKQQHKKCKYRCEFDSLTFRNNITLDELRCS